jgi:hypothetical protein
MEKVVYNKFGPAAFLALLLTFVSISPTFGQTNGLELKITIEIHDKTIAEALSQITKLTQIQFSYSREELPARRIDLSIIDEPVFSVLDRLFANASLEYRKLGELIAIRKKQPGSIASSYLSLAGHIVAADNNEPLAFASVGIAGKAKGTITNTSGSFNLRLPENFKSDTLLISMMGYRQEKIVITGSEEDIYIKMKTQPLILKAVEVTEKRISVQDIFKQIKARLEENYPVSDYAMECFYREIKKEGDTYRSLLEAALVIRDKGYGQAKSHESSYLREARGSSRFTNRFSSFWQENNLLKETLGLNAVRHPSSSPDIFGKDNYQLKHIGRLNDRDVYVLESDIKEKDCWQRTLYVDVDTYAIYRSEEVIKNFALSWKTEERDTVYMRLTKGTSVFDFKPYEGRLYLNHIRHDVENEYFNPFTGEVFSRFSIVNEVMVNDIYKDVKTAINGLKKVENQALELQVTPYNEAFWESYNFIRQTPLEAAVMKDLIENGDLNDQFVKSGKKTKQ